jgi:hypothetical protein
MLISANKMGSITYFMETILCNVCVFILEIKELAAKNLKTMNHK